MNTTTVLLLAGQFVLTFIVGYLVLLMRRDSRRSSLMALVGLLSELREKNSQALSAFFELIASEDFKRGDRQVRADLIDVTNHLRAIQAAITEALLQIVRQCDSEWGLAGQLHAAFRSQANSDTDREWDRLLARQTPAHSTPG